MGKIVFGEDEEIVVPEPVFQKSVEPELSNSDDDEAPEFITASTAKESQLAKNLAEKEATARKAASEKEKRRKRDQLLKEQKKESKEKKKKQVIEEEEIEEEEEAETLPEDLLAQAIAEEKEEVNKRKHITTEEFEKMLEEEEKKKATKRRKVDSRKVGEYAVKVINQRPRAEKKNKTLINMKETKLHRKNVPRKDAIRNLSGSKEGAALIFRRK
ncbi:unnamed protein product [Rhizopus stolonifer]